MSFVRFEDKYIPAPGAPIPMLPKAIYSVKLSPEGPYLERTADGYTFPSKVYDIEPGLVDRVVHAYTASRDQDNRPMGVLLSGLKGSGKSVLAKIICDRLNMPVIVIDRPFGFLASFLSSDAFRNTPCVVFCDEFEKVFEINTITGQSRLRPDDEKNDNSVGPADAFLALLDGSASTNPHLFIMTSNKADIGPFFVDRPGRIRYSVNFGELNPEVIMMIVNDRLSAEFAAEKKQIIDYLSSRRVLSVDSVISVIDEINRFGWNQDLMKRWFNLQDRKITGFELTRMNGTFIDTIRVPELHGLMNRSVQARNFFPDEIAPFITARLTVVGQIPYVAYFWKHESLEALKGSPKDRLFSTLVNNFPTGFVQNWVLASNSSDFDDDNDIVLKELQKMGMRFMTNMDDFMLHCKLNEEPDYDGIMNWLNGYTTLLGAERLVATPLMGYYSGMSEYAV